MRWKGLSSAQARELLQRRGLNQLPSLRPEPLWRQLVAQLGHFFALMLWVAGVLAIVAGMPQLGLAIFAVIVLNGVFALVQEYRAERASERLRQLMPQRTTVLRDGLVTDIDASELVPGDVVLLHAGDRICADMVVFEAYALSVDTSTFTGESLPITVSEGEMAYAGTFVVEGAGRGEVIHTGAETRLAGIAQLTEAGSRPVTPLARELQRVVRIIALAALATGLAFLPVAVLLGIPLSEAFLFALGVIVALVPEGLLPTVTLSLAWGAQRMAEQQALVRRLESVETLGSTSFICTDKTGTLTMNQMAVVTAWTPEGECRIEGTGYEPSAEVSCVSSSTVLKDRDDSALWKALQQLAYSAATASTGRTSFQEGQWRAEGNPLEAAVKVFAERVRRAGEARAGFVEGPRPPASESFEHIFPFDPRRRRMSVLAGGKLHVKGAPDAVVPRCEAAGISELALQSMAALGLRVLAIAVREAQSEDANLPADEVERNLRLLGLLGIEDPPRPEAAAAIASCRGAGMKVAMITGDHPATARAIARQVGLQSETGQLSQRPVLEGRELPSDLRRLGELVDQDGIVLSRVSPEDKLRIAQALQRRGHVVAMTGDGVNDGPALRQASIGVAMGRSGTDVAREAADLVLLDDNFATIVAAIRQGRATFANTKRFLTYHLTDNVAELTPFLLWALTGGQFPLALGVLQVLSLDIGTDILPALALGAEPAAPDTLRPRARSEHLLDRLVMVRAFALLGPVESLIEMMAFLVSFWVLGWRPGQAFPTGAAFLEASGAAFTAVVIGQMANAFACRSTTRWAGAVGWGGNPLLLWAISIEGVMLLLFLEWHPLAKLLGQAPPNWAGMLSALLAFPAVLGADAIFKRIRRGHEHA